MGFRTTATLSVAVVMLSIIAHQSDPDIVPAMVKQVLEITQKAASSVEQYYEKCLFHLNKLFGSYIGWNSESNVPRDVKYNEEALSAKKEKNKNKVYSKTSKELLLTKEELKKYDGEEGSKGIYIAILGSVFDVASGKQHYGPDGGYHFFAGVDGTRAFVTGEFNETGLIDDVTGLKAKDLKALYDWLQFYKKDYKYVGKVIGNFYNEKGKPTNELKKLLKAVREVEQDEAEINKEKQMLPPCNVEWIKEKGHRVWCTTKSGGVQRNWVGVPRRFKSPGSQHSRCVCVEPKTAVSDPRLGEYNDCPPGADSCWVREL